MLCYSLPDVASGKIGLIGRAQGGVPGEIRAWQCLAPAGADRTEVRRPPNAEELRFWLENMAVYHRYGVEEMAAATGLADEEIRTALKRWNLRPDSRPKPRPGDPLVVLPYPGGRHPRLGFLEGAIRPQRETKVSIFTPWDPAGYVVLDVPEAIWSNLGLTYLAHTHIATIWTPKGLSLPLLEWQRRAGGVLETARTLPNKIAFTVRVAPKPDAVEVDLSLTNGTDRPLSGLRIQNCLLLGHAAGFNRQASDNKLSRPPYAVCRSDDGKRWIITAWQPCWRTWDNPDCPCFHSDPVLPDCPPGQTVKARGYVWFYEGTDIEGEIARLAKRTGWAVQPPGSSR
jgi:hypothetical protein